MAGDSTVGWPSQRPAWPWDKRQCTHQVYHCPLQRLLPSHAEVLARRLPRRQTLEHLVDYSPELRAREPLDDMLNCPPVLKPLYQLLYLALQRAVVHLERLDEVARSCHWKLLLHLSLCQLWLQQSSCCCDQAR